MSQNYPLAVSTPSTPSTPTKPTSVVLDANVWVSSLLQQDANHQIAITWVNQYITGGGRFVAPTLLIIETAATISRNAKPSKSSNAAHQAATQLYLLPVLNIVQVDQRLVDESVKIAADCRLKSADSVYVALARLLDIPLVTFDREVQRRAASVITVIQP